MAVLIENREVDGLLLDVDGSMYSQALAKLIFDDIQTDMVIQLLLTMGFSWLSEGQVNSMKETFNQRSSEVASHAKAFIEFGGNAGAYHQMLDTVDISKHLTFDPELRETLSWLGQHMRLGIFTSGTEKKTEGTCSTLLGPDWHTLFHTVVSYDTAGLPEEKPGEKAFRFALERLGTRPERTVFIDDTPGAIIPARKLGILTVQVGRTDSPEAAFKIPNIPALRTHILPVNF